MTLEAMDLEDLNELKIELEWRIEDSVIAGETPSELWGNLRQVNAEIEKRHVAAG